MTPPMSEQTDFTVMTADDAAPIMNTLDDPIAHPLPFACRLTVGRDVMSSVIDHVSNIEFVRWLDRAAELHSDACGYTRARLLDDGMMWFVARHEIDYLQECHLDDSLTIFTWVRNVKRVKAWRDYVIIRESDRSVVCRATTLWVLVDLARRKPVRLPQEMIHALHPAVTM